MKIAFYIGKYGTFYDKLISLVTFSKYSHCEIVFDSGVSASSSIRDGGVRFTKINFDYKWEIYDLHTDEFESEVIAWFKEHDGDKYDLLGAIGSLFHINLSSKDKKYCSEACATVLDLNSTITPAGLFKELSNLRMIK